MTTPYTWKFWSFSVRFEMVALLLLLSLVPLASPAENEEAEEPPFYFTADFYERDLQKNIVKGRGNAWAKKGDRQVWADEIEVDFTTNIASANGNVHIRDGGLDIWCRHGSYNMKGSDGVLEDATIISGQVVITGDVIRKLDQDNFEVDEGTYTNCNTTLTKDKIAKDCQFAWKIYGKFFSITMGEYAHVHDAIIYFKDLPAFYSPYFVVPVKSDRQSGFLMLETLVKTGLGTGLRLPYFWAIGPWHDLTLEPTYYSGAGYHLGARYRYIYSGRTHGKASFFLMERRFSNNLDNPGLLTNDRDRVLGIGGEAAVDIHNNLALGARSHSKQAIRIVSDPFYTHDYSDDLVATHPWLRSFVSATFPSDYLLFTAKVEHHQSLIVTDDKGIDEGPVTQLPHLTFSQISLPFLKQYFFYEFDSQFTNFYRFGSGYDSISSSFNPLDKIHSDPNQQYHDGDYIRTGQRLQLEPRLIANVPMPSGFQLQPILKGGTLFYHFEHPSSEVVHREYLDIEIPFSLYLSRTFNISDSDTSDFQKINHVFQPRVIYATSLYQRPSDHPFFFRNNRQGLTNPRFDLTDQLNPYEYMRFELINRFRRKSGDTVERFLLIQLSEQFNMLTSQHDPRYARRLGPIELLTEIRYKSFTGQIEANYQLESSTNNAGEKMHEHDWSSTFAYRPSDFDYVSLGTRFRIRANRKDTEQSVSLTGAKTLPIFFDLSGGVDYNLKEGELLAYWVGLFFASKPRSCWDVTLRIGRNTYKEHYANMSFQLHFGSPNKVF